MRNEHAESDILRSPRQQFTRMRHWAKSLLSTIGLLSVLECKSLWHLRKQWTEVNCQYNGCLHVGFWVWFSSRSGWDGHCVAPWWGFQISLSKQIAKNPNGTDLLQVLRQWTVCAELSNSNAQWPSQYQHARNLHSIWKSPRSQVVTIIRSLLTLMPRVHPYDDWLQLSNRNTNNWWVC